MIILHIFFTGPFSEGHTYQENLLSKYHALLGHEVYFLTGCYAWDKANMTTVEPEEKEIENGLVQLKRVPYVRVINDYLTEKLRIVRDVYGLIDAVHPEFIMLHDVQTLANYGIRKYLRAHPEVTAIADCHADFSNSATNRLSRMIHKTLWRHMAQVIEPYIKRFYGTLPARVDFLRDVYRIPKSKCDLLVMGVDDMAVETASTSDAVASTRKRYGITEADFVIVTGGKIDTAKQQVFLLMEAIRRMQETITFDGRKPLLIIFGSVEKGLQKRFGAAYDEDLMRFAGWLSPDETMRLLSVADLVVYPGRHSVLWEQTVGVGVPIICKYWEGTTHVDVGGNARFLYHDTVEEMMQTLSEVVTNQVRFNSMRMAAIESGKKHFSYKEIAQKSLLAQSGS